MKSFPQPPHSPQTVPRVSETVDVDFSKHLRSLSCFLGQKLEAIQLLPSQLGDELDQVDVHSAALSVKELKVILLSNEVSKELFQRLNKLEVSLNHLETQTQPITQSSFHQFFSSIGAYSMQKNGGVETTSTTAYNKQDTEVAACTGDQSGRIGEERHKIDLISKYYDDITELLALPQFMEALVVNDFYDEAMELELFVRTLESRFSSIPLLQSIRQQVAESLQRMQQRLCAVLQAPIQLHSCLRVIGYFRRMNVFSTSQLRMLFLSARHRHHQESVAAMEESVSVPAKRSTTNTSPLSVPASSNAQNHSAHRVHFPQVDATMTGAASTEHESVLLLKSFIDLTRSNLMDIITQYQAVFSHSLLPSSTASVKFQSPPSSTSDSSTPQFTDLDLTANYSIHDANYLPASATLSSFLLQFIQEFFDKMSSRLAMIHDMSEVNTILTHAMHFGIALARKGADIRPLLAAIFESRVEFVFHEQFSLHASEFIETFHRTDLHLLQLSHKHVSRNSFSATTHHSHMPPHSLLQYPLLSALTNAFLASFNQLRFVPMLSLAPSLAEALKSQLLLLTQVLRDRWEERDAWDKVDATTASTPITNHQTFIAFATAFLTICVPYVVKCFSAGIFGGSLESLSYLHGFVLELQREVVDVYLNEEKQELVDVNLTEEKQEVADIGILQDNLSFGHSTTTSSTALVVDDVKLALFDKPLMEESRVVDE